MGYAKLGMAAVGAATAYGISRARGRGRRARGTTSIKPGRLVAYNTSPMAPLFEVLPASVLDDDSLSTDLTEAGWRLAESYNKTGYRILVRVRPGGTPRWQARWAATVVPVEVREVETETADTAEGFALVAALGQPIKAANPLTRAENLD